MSPFIKRPVLLSLSLVLAVTLGCGGGGGGANSSDPDVAVELIVKNITPTNSQEVLSDLSDPGLGGVVKVSFSERIDANTILDNSNAFNGLSSDVNILNSAFERVPGVPLITGDENNILAFTPAGNFLPNGQYTVTVTRDVKNFQGGRMNGGRYDFRSSFTVGPDFYSPVIRNTFPAPNQTDVPKTSQIIVTFSESLDPGSVNTNTITVQDTAQVPAATVTGTVSMARDNFEAVFTPDPATPMPPNGKIEVTVTGGAAGITDIHGNPFAGDPATPGIYQFRFDTVTEPPLPNNPTPLPSLTTLPLAHFYATGTKVGVIDESVFYAGNFVDLTQWGIHRSGPPIIPNPVPNSETNIGKPDEMFVDPRLSPTDGHTYLYVIDLQSRSVVVMSTRTSRIVHRWKELPDPVGLAMSVGGMNLWVANQSSDTVSLLDLSTITVGQEGATQALKDVPKKRIGDRENRKDYSLDPTGTRTLGPVSLAHLISKTALMVVNRVDNSVTELNTSNGTVTDTLSLNQGPRDVAVSNFVMLGLTPIGHFAWITCEGGGDDANGSVALWWEDWLPLGINSGKGRIQAMLGGFKNPRGLVYDFGTSGGGIRSCWIANSGGNTVSRMSINVSGAGLATTILPSITADIPVGNNPSDCTLDGTRLVTGNRPVVLTADLGSGQVTFVDTVRLTAPTFSLKIPGVRRITSFISQ